MSEQTVSIEGRGCSIRVSVIIPVYNVERFLARCLDSVLESARGIDAEIICVNDGSTDGSRSVLSGYAERVIIIDQENRGQAAARNRGLDVATGEYVMFVDSDDWIPSDAISKFLDTAQQSGLDVVVSGEYLKDRRPKKTEPLSWRRVERAIEEMVADRRVRSCVWNKLYSAKILRDCRFVEGIKYEDWPFLVDVFTKISAFALIRDPLYVYCTNAGVESTIHSQFTQSRVSDYLKGVRYVLGRYRNAVEYAAVRKRAGIAVSMLINKAVRSGDMQVAAAMAEGVRAVAEDFPGLMGCVCLKSRIRLWLMSLRIRSV